MRPEADPDCPPVALGMADCAVFVSPQGGVSLARSTSSGSAPTAPHQPLLHLTGDVSCYREGTLHRLIAARNVPGVRQWLSNPFCRDTINDFNHAGETPLHVALHVCEPRILSLLLNPPPVQMPPQCLLACSSSSGGGGGECVGVAPSGGGTSVHGEWAADAANAAAAAAAATVDFSLPLDDIPALHILVGRSSFAHVRADAAECLRRLLHHVGLLHMTTGGSRVCSRCTFTSTSSRGSRSISSGSCPPRVECGLQELDLDATDGSGKTALHVAAAGGGAAAVELLLHAGADPLIADKRGLLPLHVAVDSRSVGCLLLLLAHTFPEDCFYWCDKLEQQQQERLVVGSSAEAASVGECSDARAPKKVVLQRAERRPLVHCATSSSLVYRIARRCVRRCSFRCLAALLSYPLVAACSGRSEPSSEAPESVMALQLLHAQQLQELVSLARRSGCLQLFLSTLSELVDAEPSHSVAEAVIAEATGGRGPLQGPITYVQQRCSRSGRCYRVPEAAGTLLATHESCMHHLPLPEPSDFPVKRFKLMQRFPENPSRLEVLVHPSSGVLKAAEFRHLDWIDNAAPASLADILRVHDVSYIFRLKQKIRSTFGTRSVNKSFSGSSSSSSYGGPSPVDQFAYSFADGDTPVTALSWEAATSAAGTVIAAVDAVCTGAKVNAFCAVRPPGHHLGSWGAAQTAPYALTDEDIAAGSQGFCVLNNVAIGAAYARYNYAHRGIRRIAIVDFDAHHGNGTEQIMRNVGLKFRKLQGLSALLADGSSPAAGQRTHREAPWGPPSDSWEAEGARAPPEDGAALQDVPVQLPMWLGWRDENDSEELFFASIHAFDGNFYPGTGADCEDFGGPTILNVTMPVHGACSTPVEGSEGDPCCRCERCSEQSCIGPKPRGAHLGTAAADAACASGDEGGYRCHHCRRPGLSPRSIRSRLLFKHRVLRRLEAFRPDLIFLSAGFDGHIKDPIGGEAVGWTEDDFHWLTMQVQRVAHRHCRGRCISVLEGGYNVRGGSISPLALCVREHVRALVKAAHMQQEIDAHMQAQQAHAAAAEAHSQVHAKTVVGVHQEARRLTAAGGLQSVAGSSGEESHQEGRLTPTPHPEGSDQLDQEGPWAEPDLSDYGSDSGFSSSEDETDAFLDECEAADHESAVTEEEAEESGPSAAPVAPGNPYVTTSSQPPFCAGVTSQGHTVQPAAVPFIASFEEVPQHSFGPTVGAATTYVHPPVPGDPCCKEHVVRTVLQPTVAAAAAGAGQWVGHEDQRVFHTIQEGITSPSAISSLSDDTAAASSGPDAAAAAAAAAQPAGGFLVGAPCLTGSVVSAAATGPPPLPHQQPSTVLATSTSASDAEASPRVEDHVAAEVGEPYSKAQRLQFLCGFPG